jgi:hypothetical protein
MTDIVLLVVSLVIILAGAELFVNGVEWLGKLFNLSEGAVGSVLAAVGTALPETIIHPGNSWSGYRHWSYFRSPLDALHPGHVRNRHSCIRIQKSTPDWQ